MSINTFHPLHWIACVQTSPLTHLYADLAEHLYSLSRILQCHLLGRTDYHSSINLDQLREREGHIPRPRGHVDDKYIQLFPLLPLWKLSFLRSLFSLVLRSCSAPPVHVEEELLHGLLHH